MKKYPIKLFPLVFLTVVLFILLIIPSTSSRAAVTVGPDQAIISDINSQLDQQRSLIDELTNQIEAYKKNVKDAREQTVSLQNQIYILDNQIAKTNLDIKVKEEEIKSVELEMEKVKLEMKKNQADAESQKEKLANFIRLINRYDNKNYLEVLLSNASFSDFFDQLKYSENLQKDLQKTLNQIQELGEKLAQQQKDLDNKKEQLSQLLNQLEDSQAVLDEQKRSKNQLVLITKKSEKKFQTLIADLKQAQAAANNQVAALEKSLRTELAKKGTAEKLNTLGEANLIWPTDSRRITCIFHDPEYPYRYLFEHSGLDIGVPNGTPVKAAEAGYVAKVALGTQWYGNYIMIIHSDNLSTLYAHLKSVSVSPDQYVSRGQVIGLSDNTGFSSGPHLHFETRANGVPVDPLSYLP